MQGVFLTGSMGDWCGWVRLDPTREFCWDAYVCRAPVNISWSEAMKSRVVLCIEPLYIHPVPTFHILFNFPTFLKTQFC